MENIRILSEDDIIRLKTNLSVVQEKMQKCPDNSWLKDFFQKEDPFIKAKYSMEDFELDTSKEDPVETDLQNAITIHKNLKNLPICVLCDERLWVGLGFDKFYNYMQYRWPSNKIINLKSHWFYDHGQKRGMYFDGISRLFWFAEYTFDETLDNPYELTEFCFKNITLITNMVYRSYVNSKNVRLSIFKAVKKFINDGGEFSNKNMYNILKYVSFLGGAYILDSFTQNELIEKIYNKLIQLYINDNPQQKVFKLR